MGADEGTDAAGQQIVVADPGSRSISPAAEPSKAVVDSIAGGALRVQDDDEAGICERLFKGLVFFLGREVPREQLLFVIRAFGGVVAWQGEGSPMDESDERITHQVRRSQCVHALMASFHNSMNCPALQPIRPTSHTGCVFCTVHTLY